MSDAHTAAHIPDGAVQAALDEYYPLFTPSKSAADDMRRALTAAFPHLSAPCAVTKPVDVAAVREAEAVIERNGEELTASLLIGFIAQVLREKGKAVLTATDNSLGKQILEFKVAADNIRALSPAEPAQGDQWHIGLGRLPTLQEAQQAARVLNACNGVDLSDWTDDLWPCDDLTEGLKALLTAAPAPAPEAGK